MPGDAFGLCFGAEHAICFLVPLSRDRAHPRAVSLFEGMPGAANPADAAGRDADHKRVIGHVFGDDRARSDERPGPDAGRGDAHCTRPDGCATAYFHSDRFPIVSALWGAVGVHRAREDVVGEHGRRPNENAIGEPCWLVDERIVLQLAAVAEHDIRANVRATTDVAVGAEPRAFADLGKVPDPRSGAERRRLGDVGGVLDSGQVWIGHGGPFVRRCGGGIHTRGA